MTASDWMLAGKTRFGGAKRAHGKRHGVGKRRSSNARKKHSRGQHRQHENNASVRARVAAERIYWSGEAPDMQTARHIVQERRLDR